MIVLTLTRAQRDGLLYGWRRELEYAEEKDGGHGPKYHAPVMAQLAEELSRESDDGTYTITVRREKLVPFLEHTVRGELELEFLLEGEILSLWHASVTLLDQLGHTVDGDIYTKIVCQCECCEGDRKRDAYGDARLDELLPSNWREMEREETRAFYRDHPDINREVLALHRWLSDNYGGPFTEYPGRSMAVA